MLLCRGRQQCPLSACLHREGQPAPWHDKRRLAKPSSRPGPGRPGGGGTDDNGPRGWAAVVAAWVAQAPGRPSRPKVKPDPGLCRKSRDDNASQASLVTADGGRYGGCVPLPPSCGGWVPQPRLPAGTASVTIQRYATELCGGTRLFAY